MEITSYFTLILVNDRFAESTFSICPRFCNWKLYAPTLCKMMCRYVVKSSRPDTFCYPFTKPAEVEVHGSHPFKVRHVLRCMGCSSMVSTHSRVSSPRLVTESHIFLTKNFNVSAKTNVSAHPFFAVSQGPMWVRFMKKKCPKIS